MCLFALALQGFGSNCRACEQPIEIDLPLADRAGLVLAQAIGQFRIFHGGDKLVLVPAGVQLFIGQIREAFLPRPCFHVIRVNDP